MSEPPPAAAPPADTGATAAGREAPGAGVPGWDAVWLIGLLLFIAGALLGRTAGADLITAGATLAATLLGGLVGATELVARYRDAPTVALRTQAGKIYIAVNAGVSLLVFLAVHSGGFGIGHLDSIDQTISDVLVAGIGAMGLLRTSLFTLRVKDTDVPVGPAAVLQVILAAADRACDRDRAGPRALRVEQIMRGVSFARARLTLPLHCLTLMQNVSAEERSQLNQSIAELADQAMSDEVKAYNLGLLLMNYTGIEVLEKAVRGIGIVIQGPAPDDPPILTRARAIDPDDLVTLIAICEALEPLDSTGRRAACVEAQRAGWLKVDTAVTDKTARVVIVLARLRRFFGADTLSSAMALLGLRRGPLQPDPMPPDPSRAADAKPGGQPASTGTATQTAPPASG